MYNFLVSTFLEFHTTLIDAIEAIKPLIGQTPFEVTAKDVNIKYMTLKMPEGHNSTVFGVIMRMPEDSKLTFRCPILASDQYFDQNRLAKKKLPTSGKKIVVPLTEEG